MIKIRNTLLLFNKNHLIRMASSDKIADMRKPYKGQQETFGAEDLVAKEPFANFRHWFDIARKTDGIMEANAMSLATATKDGKPSVRMVLMKGFDSEGFRFFSNYGSRKAQELEENPQASLCFYWSNVLSEENTWSRQEENPQAQLMFYWEPLMQSVRIEGRVEKLSEKANTEYFHSRPKSSQIGACVSYQSTEIADRKVLEDRQKELEEKYKEVDVLPKPEFWGGYVLKPEVFEFWQGQTNRIHDRLVFRLKEGATCNESEDSWQLVRLSP